MTPAEVIAMRDRLAVAYREAHHGVMSEDSARGTADWLIESGWVTSEPKENVLDCKREEESK